MIAKRSEFPRLFGGLGTARPTIRDRFERGSVVVGRGVPTAPASRAFTLIELVVVLAVIAMMAMSLLSALARSTANTKVTACAANFRQWGVSVNLYAQDNKGYLPRPWPDPAAGGMYGWSASTNLGYAMFPYGASMPVWFCPVRPNEFDVANAWCLQVLGHSLLTIQDFLAYSTHSSALEVILNFDWWVPRAQGTTLFPIDYSSKPISLQPNYGKGSDPFVYGWPVRVDDRASARVAFISDKCGSGSGNGFAINGNVGTSVTNITPNTAHFFNGVLYGVNAAYVDGHVESRGPARIRCVYATISTYWFY